MTVQLIDLLRQNIIISSKSSWDRLWGMIFVNPKSGPFAMWFPKCNAIHMFFMRFPLDLIFLDRRRVVVKIMKNVRPWTPWAGCWKADSVIEIIPGHWDESLVKVGDQLVFE